MQYVGLNKITVKRIGEKKESCYFWGSFFIDPAISREKGFIDSRQTVGFFSDGTL